MMSEEAINFLKHRCDVCAGGSNRGGCASYSCSFAMREAFKSLEKQIPMKPVTRVVNTGFNLPIPCQFHVCPICGVDTPIPRDLESWESWCPDCGQALDWSEV